VEPLAILMRMIIVVQKFAVDARMITKLNAQQKKSSRSNSPAKKKENAKGKLEKINAENLVTTIEDSDSTPSSQNYQSPMKSATIISSDSESEQPNARLEAIVSTEIVAKKQQKGSKPIIAEPTTKKDDSGSNSIIAEPTTKKDDSGSKPTIAEPTTKKDDSKKTASNSTTKKR